MERENRILAAEGCCFRWINCQCFEIRLPGGKTIVTDPCYDFPRGEKPDIADLFRLEGFHTSDLTGCDYVILNHTHGDHMSNLGEIIERFSPVVICHSGVAAEIAETFPFQRLTSLYPVDYGGIYYFDGFRLETFHGQHKPQGFTWAGSMAEGDVISKNPRLSRLHTLGSFFNMNFLLTLDNGLRLAFVGGTNDGMEKRLEELRPNLVMRNKLANDMDVDKAAGEWFSFMKESHAQIVVPMHFEVWENQEPGFAARTFEEANRLAEESGLSTRLLPPERTKWYRLSLNVTAAEVPPA